MSYSVLDSSPCNVRMVYVYSRRRAPGRARCREVSREDVVPTTELAAHVDEG